MMEEVSTGEADAMERMSEEEILACLVTEAGPTVMVPIKKAKLKEGKLEVMEEEDEEEDDKDPADKYLKENLRLQQTSLRLEQENDNLAHRLISSKVALRNALDKAEDRVDELSKEIVQTRHLLESTEAEKRRREEEATMLKEVFRREVEKAELEVKRSSGIISDYKQICCQLNQRLERQTNAHRDQLDSIKGAVRSCSQCQNVLDTIQTLRPAEDHEDEDEDDDDDDDDDDCGEKENRRMVEAARYEVNEALHELERRRDDKEKESLRAQIRSLEKQLAQTKLLLVESKCTIQELNHEKCLMSNELQEAKNTWINKALTSLKNPNSPGLQGLTLPRHGAPALGGNQQRGFRSGRKMSWHLGEN